VYVIVPFDTEDIYYPPEARIDDIPGWLARIMSEVGITGTFLVMGEKAEKLLERGRRDVLDAMAQHDIGSHQQGNRFPLLPQVVEGKGWQDGVEAVREYEAWVTEQLRQAFGKEPVSFSRHNCYFAPQHVAVAGQRDLPYLYMIEQIPGSLQPLWYAGALTFPMGDSTFSGFDRIYSRDELFEKRFAELGEAVEKRLANGADWMMVFGCHPVQVMAHGWIEHRCLATGQAQTPQELGWQYAVKPPAEEERAKANFRRLCTYLKEHPDLEVIGIEEAARLFSTQPPSVGRDALVAYAADMVRSDEIAFHTTFSPAELLCAFTDAITRSHGGADLPDEVPRRDVLGPVERPVVAQEMTELTADQLVAVCQELLRQVESDGHLPANLTADGQRLGLGQIALLAATTYLALARHDRYERLAVPQAPRYPKIALELDAWVRTCIGDHWAMPLDFSCEALAEHTRLQTWTMKPAWLHPPHGPLASGPYTARREATG